MSQILAPRMIQNLTNATTTVYYWGYALRAVPCTNDAGSCAYLDVVYDTHVLSMLYSGIFWAAIGGILLVWGIGRRLLPSSARDTVSGLEIEPQTPGSRGAISRLGAAFTSTVRAHLLPNSVHALVGYTTRLQVVILSILIGYLSIFTFVGITYSTWVTPVKGQPAGVNNTRTSLGPFADRIGVLAYALTPLSVLLSSRESLLSIVTGVPYTSFMFLHRWTGYIILIQSAVHTLGWVVVEARLYQPQPSVWNSLVAQPYIQWGFVALVLIFLIWFFSLRWTIRNITGYEFFRKSHYVLAMVYIGAVIAHWQLLLCFLVPGIVLWFVDRMARMARTVMLHHDPEARWGFSPAQAQAKIWKDDRDGDVFRLDFDHPQAPWLIGQHFFLCFTEGSIWQSHPFTPLSLPVAGKAGRVRHSYLVRAKKGETKKIAALLESKGAASVGSGDGGKGGMMPMTSVVLQGPYGENIVRGLTPDANVLCVAGGTGITYVLPVLLRLVIDRPVPDRKIELVWAVRRAQDVEWIRPELDELRRAASSHGIRILIFATADQTISAAAAEKASLGESGTPEDKEVDGQHVVLQRASSGHSQETIGHRPDVKAIVRAFVESTVRGSTTVFGSGPGGMISDLRSAVASCNSGAKVWRGEERFDVNLVCDDRLEW